MHDLCEEHIFITSEVKKRIEAVKVVFPAQYGKLYTEIARSRNIDLKPDEFLTREMLDEKMVRHVITLASCSNQAIEAMQKDDQTALQEVIAATKTLHDEIHELQKMVYEDNLTKSYNRKWFEDTHLNTDQESMRESGTFVMIDLNKFKMINDTYGHVIGDKVLMHVALKLKETGGSVVRYGGDEFIVIFHSKISSDRVHEKIEKTLHYFKKIHFKAGGNKEFKIDFAYGLADFIKGKEYISVVETADKAMYDHKHTL
jgi:diguanylate cyclase